VRFSPFDQHPEGDGSLRGNGLVAETWRICLTTVLNSHGRLKALSSADDLSQVDREQLIAAFDSFSAPAGLCKPGSTEARPR
jgi:hypothetical protein